jgi:hypothetical protein
MRSLIATALVGIATVGHAQTSVNSLAIASRSCDRQCTVLRGAVIGLSIGAIGGAVYGAHEDRTDNFGSSAVGIDAAAFGVVGGFIGAIIGALWPLRAATPIVTAVVPVLPVRSGRTPEWRVGMHVGF